MGYALLKSIHIGTVFVTVSLFLTRGVWMLTDSPRLQARWLKVVPHLNDTLLLAAGIGMLIAGGIDPFRQPWLEAKFIGLLLYIGLGSLALKRSGSKARRASFFAAALAAVGYIIAVAVTKQVIPGVV